MLHPQSTDDFTTFAPGHRRFVLELPFPPLDQPFVFALPHPDVTAPMSRSTMPIPSSPAAPRIPILGVQAPTLDNIQQLATPSSPQDADPRWLTVPLSRPLSPISFRTPSRSTPPHSNSRASTLSPRDRSIRSRSHSHLNTPPSSHPSSSYSTSPNTFYRHSTPFPSDGSPCNLYHNLPQEDVLASGVHAKDSESDSLGFERTTTHQRFTTPFPGETEPRPTSPAQIEPLGRLVTPALSEAKYSPEFDGEVHGSSSLCSQAFKGTVERHDTIKAAQGKGNIRN
ncbi:hypothetical protein CCMSSC00406_0003048 [Pleurotus cornucopiae]|uniref:Uncharacterized protein n=1 Tax=Pleurotus cornucopiae TaxID=5321 RepID=A0ACB7J5K3_PLECO|nr:hypothetical protein CCMSSC00406_0003048 [Pleurotus cornucopiae]